MWKPQPQQAKEKTYPVPCKEGYIDITNRGGTAEGHSFRPDEGCGVFSAPGMGAV